MEEEEEGEKAEGKGKEGGKENKGPRNWRESEPKLGFTLPIAEKSREQSSEGLGSQPEFCNSSSGQTES